MRFEPPELLSIIPCLGKDRKTRLPQSGKVSLGSSSRIANTLSQFINGNAKSEPLQYLQKLPLACQLISACHPKALQCESTRKSVFFYRRARRENACNPAKIIYRSGQSFKPKHSAFDMLRCLFCIFLYRFEGDQVHSRRSARVVRDGACRTGGLQTSANNHSRFQLRPLLPLPSLCRLQTH